MKLAVNYVVKSFLIWTTLKTVYQLVKTLEEEYTTFQALPFGKDRFTVRICFGYTSVMILFKSNNKTLEDCVEIFGRKQCKTWLEDRIRLPQFYLKNYAPRKFIEFGRRVFTKNQMIEPDKAVWFDQSYYLAQRMLCMLWQKNTDFDDGYFLMFVNSNIPVSEPTRMILRIYTNNRYSYPDKNNYLFSTSIEQLRQSPAIVILLRQELYVQRDLNDLSGYLRHTNTRHVNSSLLFCRYRCERQFKLHNPILMYLDEDIDVTLSDENLRDQLVVNDLIENCILKNCRLMNDINSFYTVGGISRFEEQELITKTNNTAIHIWFYMGDLIFTRSKLCLLDFAINVGFAFSLYFGWNLISVKLECLTRKRVHLSKLYDLLLLVVSIFLFANICNHYYSQINEIEYSRYSRFFPQFSNFTFSVCFPLDSMVRNKSQTFNQIKVGELDEKTHTLEEITVGFNLLNMATLKRFKIEHYPTRSFYFRNDKCWAFNLNRSIIFTKQAFFEADEKSQEVYFRLFERYFQVYLIFDTIYKIYITEHGTLPYDKTELVAFVQTCQF